MNGKNGNMSDTKKTRKARKPRRAAQDLRVVGIHFNPGPDAQDRLRRIFTLLLKHANGGSSLSPNKDVSLESSEPEASAEKEFEL